MRRALLCASLALAAACQRDPARPARDAVQEAFREGGLTARQAFGHRLFVARCATCHGALGRGDGQNAYNLDPAPPDFQSSLTRLPLAARRRLQSLAPGCDNQWVLAAWPGPWPWGHRPAVDDCKPCTMVFMGVLWQTQSTSL